MTWPVPQRNQRTGRGRACSLDLAHERDEWMSGRASESQSLREGTLDQWTRGTWGCECVTVCVRFDRQDTRLDKEHAANQRTEPKPFKGATWSLASTAGRDDVSAWIGLSAGNTLRLRLARGVR